MKQKKILVVEDNPLNLRLVEQALAFLNINLMKAINGEQALTMASEEKPDLIILDIQIPKIDGYEVTRRLKNDPELKQIPIVALTAYAMKSDEEKILAIGCDAYVSKPLQLSSFRQLIQNYLQKPA